MSQRITIVINTDSPAFGEDPDRETANILRAMANRLSHSPTLPVPTDSAGRVVGSVSYAPLGEGSDHG